MNSSLLFWLAVVCGVCAIGTAIGGNAAIAVLLGVAAAALYGGSRALEAKEL